MQGTKTTLKVGKNGVTPGVLEEIKRQLKKGKVEIEIQKGALLKEDGSLADRKEFARELAEKAGARLVKIMGYHMILDKKRASDNFKSKPVQSTESSVSEPMQKLVPHPVKRD